jgi:hypothetical protein
MLAMRAEGPGRCSPRGLALRVIGASLAAALAFASAALAPLAAGASGDGWSLHPLSGQAKALKGDSCVSAQWCMTVGMTKGNGNEMPATDMWKGQSPIAEQPVVPAGAVNGQLVSVSCVTSSFCMAVGTYETGSSPHGPERALAETWNGSGWSIQDAVNPNDAQNGFSGVSCVSVDLCLAVGLQRTTETETLAEAWDGSAWTVLPTLDPGPAGNVFSGVSCTPSGASGQWCMAVGTSDPGETDQALLAETWNGSAWTQTPVPSPGSEAALAAVSCPNSEFCLGVGGFPDFGGTVAEEWDGTTWALQTIPKPADHGALFAVSCATTELCMAVGANSHEDSYQKDPLAELWNGSEWVKQAMARVADAPEMLVNGVSCPSAKSTLRCNAVGTTASPLTDRKGPLAESYRG